MSRSRGVGGDVTIIDVAREAGVSHATVSRVINQSAYVEPEKQERVIRAMTRLGYVPNQQARSLAGGRSQVIGLLAADLTNPFIGLIYTGIEEELAHSQYDLLLYTTHRRKTKESAHVATLTKGLADGLLIIVPRNPEAYLEALRQGHFPHVLIEYPGEEHDSAVFLDHQGGAEGLMAYLIGLGHRRIALITGRDIYTAQIRLDVYQAQLVAAGIAVVPDYIRQGDFFQLSGYHNTQALLSLPEPPTAIVASNDVMALGAYDAARERGLHIPDDITIVGFDDIPQASYARPGLTTIKAPLEEMGRLATRILFDMIADPTHETQRIQLPTELIIRDSSCPPRHP